MRGLDDPRTVDRYIEVRAQIAALQEEEKELRDELLEAIMDEPGEKFEHAGCEFKVRRTPKWQYSEQVAGDIANIEEGIKDLQQQIKDLQDRAKQTGQAQVVKQTASLVFTVPKVKA